MMIRAAFPLLLTLAMVHGCAAPGTAENDSVSNCIDLNPPADVVRWVGDGTAVAVGSAAASEIRLFSWPGLQELLRVSSAAGGEGWTIDGRSVATGLDQSVSWLETGAAGVTMWRHSQEQGLERLGDLPHPRFSNFWWTREGLVARELNLDDQGRISLLALGASEVFTPQELTEYRSGLEELWVARNGAAYVFETNTAGVSTELTIVVGENNSVVNLGFPGGTGASLLDRAAAVMYRDFESARLVAIRPSGSPLPGELSSRDALGGEVSESGDLALITTYAPGDVNSLCIEGLRDMIASWDK